MIHVLARKIHLLLPNLVLELAYHTPDHHHTMLSINPVMNICYKVASSLYLSPALFLEKKLPNLYFLVGSVSMSSWDSPRLSDPTASPSSINSWSTKPFRCKSSASLDNLHPSSKKKRKAHKDWNKPHRSLYPDQCRLARIPVALTSI